MQAGVTEAPPDPTVRIWVESTGGFRVTIRLFPANGFTRRNPLQLQARLRPPTHGQRVIQVDKSPVRPATRIPHPNGIRSRRPARPERAAYLRILTSAAIADTPGPVDKRMTETA